MDDKFDYKYPTSKSTSRSKADNDEYRYAPADDQPKKFSRQPVKPSVKQSQSYNRAGYGQPGHSGRKKVTPNSQTGLLMGITIAVGILICLGAFFLMYTLTVPKPVKTGPIDTEIPVDTDHGAEDGNYGLVNDESDTQASGVIKNLSKGTISLINAEDGSDFEVFVNSDTSYKDKFGQTKTLQQFVEGEIVVAEYNSTSKKAQIIRSDPEAWQKSDIKNVQIDTKTTSVKIGNDTFEVPDNVIFLPVGTDHAVKSSDIVTLKGRATKLLTVIIERRTGTIEFVNKEKIVDGTVEVDTDIYKALDEANSLDVLEGSHTIVVKGTNIDVFVRDITINAGQNITIDLNEAKLREGVINLEVNEPDYNVYVNDNLVTSGPIKVPFGTYKLRVTKDGFLPWEGNATVSGASVNVTANLVEEVKMGRITVTTAPDGVGGSVYIDNALIGTAPVKTQVTYGTHQLTVKESGYDDTSITIIVDGDSTYQVTMRKTVSNPNPNQSGDPESANSDTIAQ